MSIIVTLLVLSFLIFFHELGHFLAARMFGVQVDVFSIGFGKKIFSKKIGKTEYALSLIPLGGYVKMKGQNDFNPSETSKDSDAYSTKKPWQRIIILLAGAVFNLILAFFIFFGLSLGETPTLTSKIGKIMPNSAAESAGLLVNDNIVALDDIPIKWWHEVTSKMKENKGEPVKVSLIRDGKFHHVILEPKNTESENIFGEKIKRHLIGISPSGETAIFQFTPIEALQNAVLQTYNAATLIIKGIQKLVSGVLPIDNVGGVIGMAQATDSAYKHGLTQVLFLTALISVNLFVVNLLPIPALDGGHILFNIYEMIFKRPPSETMFTRLTIAGWAFLLALMLLGVYNDLQRLMVSK